MNVFCKFDSMKDISSIVKHPKNKNIHPQNQIELLKKVLKKNGVRRPLIISKDSGFLVTGHGVLQALDELKEKQAPVVYQSFKSEKDEFRFLISDNEVSRHSYLDIDSFYKDVNVLFGDDFDKNDFGLIDFQQADFNVETFENEDDGDGKQEKPDKTKSFKCPHCEKLIEI